MGAPPDGRSSWCRRLIKKVDDQPELGGECASRCRSLCISIGCRIFLGHKRYMEHPPSACCCLYRGRFCNLTESLSVTNKVDNITEIEHRAFLLGRGGSFHFSIEKVSGVVRERCCQISFETEEAAEEARQAALAMIDKVVNITRDH